MKRTISLILALVFVLALSPGVLADVIIEPSDSFYAKHREECQHWERGYLACGPGDSATVYRSPESAAVVRELQNGTELWISYVYTAPDGTKWGFCEYYADDSWTGWMPMDHLLLKYDSICFREEFAARITEETGTVEAPTEGRIHFWGYPGSDTLYAAMEPEADYLPEYLQTFNDDSGRKWGYVGYHMGLRDVWVCLDDPTADYDTLYADLAPQQVTHPTMDTVPAEIKPAGPSMRVVLLAVCAVAVLSGGFLWVTRKKK